MWGGSDVHVVALMGQPPWVVRDQDAGVGDVPDDVIDKPVV